MIHFIDGQHEGKANVPTVGLSIEAIGQCKMSHCTEDWLQKVLKVVDDKVYNYWSYPAL